MKTLFKAAVVIAVVVAIAPSLAAQWPPHPTAGVPRTPDGKPDLDGRTPRTPDGKQDLSGIWQTPRNALGPVNAGQPSPGVPPPPPLPPGGIAIATFGYAGLGFMEGLP